MKNSNLFKVPAREDVSPEAQTIFDNLQRSLGKVPNLYATIAASGNALASYMAYVQAQARGTFHHKDREAIYLIVSELNGCEYCLASHTVSGMKAGWTEEETLQLRAGTFTDAKWKAIYDFISSVIAGRGTMSDEVVKAFYAVGYDQKAAMDLMILINVMSLTNYTYRLTQIPLDFPPAKSLK